MDRLAAMALLVAAVDGGSLSAAGRRLGMPLATVSRRITDLEAHLQTRLLNRSSRRLGLTDAGEDYLAACRRILETVDEAERAAAGEFRAPRGTLVVTAPIVFGRLHLLPLASQFLKAYPDVDLRLQLADRVVNLFDDHVDLALRIGALPDSSLIATRVATIRRVVCASPAYLRRRGVPTHPEQLSAHDCVAFESRTAAPHWRFRADNSDLLVPLRARLAVNTAEAAIDAAIAGVGITAVLSYQVATAIADGKLRRLLQKFEPAALPVSLVYAGGGRLPQKLRAFIDFVAPKLRARLAQDAGTD